MKIRSAKSLMIVGLSVALVAAVVVYWAWGRSHAVAGPASPQKVTVFAAASTKESLSEIAAAFERQTGAKVLLNFAASSTLARQIEAGAAADVFLSADQEWMDYLAAKSLIRKDGRVDLLGNDLVLVAARSGTPAVRMEKGFDLAGSFQGRLSLGDPAHVPAGKYARESLEFFGWWDAMKDRLAPCADVRSALRLVETGETPLGIVYATDAAASTGVAVVAAFPPGSHKPIVYPAALASTASAAGERFLRYLQGEVAREIFRRHGFAFLPPIAATQATEATAPQEDIAAAVMLSLKVALWCMAAIAAPGVALGWLLARKQFAGKVALDAMVHAPLVLPPVVVGYLALLALGRYGPVGRCLDAAGIRLAFTWHGAVVVAGIMALPLMVRAVRLAIELADPRLEQAAATLGASPARVFATVTLPLALPGVVSGLVLAFARSLGEFGATITFAGNIEGQTRTLPLAIYSLTASPGGDSPAMTLVLISLGLSLGAILISEVLADRLRRRLAGAQPC